MVASWEVVSWLQCLEAEGCQAVAAGRRRVPPVPGHHCVWRGWVLEGGRRGGAQTHHDDVRSLEVTTSQNTFPSRVTRPYMIHQFLLSCGVFLLHTSKTDFGLCSLCLRLMREMEAIVVPITDRRHVNASAVGTWLPLRIGRDWLERCAKARL